MFKTNDVMVDPLYIHGVVRDSPYAKLFVNMYYLTKPKSEDGDLVKEEVPMIKISEVGSKYENISDPEDIIEEGEISESDRNHQKPYESKFRAKSPTGYVFPSVDVANEEEPNLFKVPPPPSELKVFRKKQKLKLNSDKVIKNDHDKAGSLKINQFPSLKRMKSILIRRSSGDIGNEGKKFNKQLLSPSSGIESVKQNSSNCSSNLLDYSSSFDSNDSGAGGKELKMNSNKFLTDIQSQFDLDRSPARLEWLQCYLSKETLLIH